MSVPRALIVANGDMPLRTLLQTLVRGAAFVVGADGGGDKALAAGITPDLVVGDLDSLSEAARAELGPERCLYIENPDTTDLQKAVELCIERGFRAIDVVAAGGGRMDHALGNLSVLTLFDRTIDIHLHDDLFDISRVSGSAEIEAPPGTVVSLIAIGPCIGVTTRGLRWDLAAYPLAFSPYGIHNEVRELPASVSVESGDLLLLLGRWIEKHR